MAQLLSILILVGIVTSASSYPIDPRPLRKLVIESEYIVIGQVMEIRKARHMKEAWSPSSIASIKIIEVLKGKIDEQIIDVPYNGNFICPAPPRYKEGTSVLVFLDKTEDKDFRTHALSYGAKTLSSSDIEIYKARIQEMQEILTISNEDTKFMETVEWLVKCTEQEATRWEGTYELSPESDFMSFYARSEQQPFRYLLSEEQKIRLKHALFESTNSQYCDFGLVDLVYPSNEIEVRAFLINGLKNIDDRRLWMADEYMRRLLLGKTSPELERLVERYSDLQFEQGKRTELKEIVKDFLVLAEAN